MLSMQMRWEDGNKQYTIYVHFRFIVLHHESLCSSQLSLERELYLDDKGNHNYKKFYHLSRVHVKNFDEGRAISWCHPIFVPFVALGLDILKTI